MKKTKHKKTSKLSKSVKTLFMFEAAIIFASIIMLAVVILRPNGSVDIPNDISYVKEDQ